MEISTGMHKNIHEVIKNLEYLGVEVPRDFEKEAIENIAAHEKVCRSLSKYTISQVIRIADFWEPAFAGKQEYDKFVIGAIYRLYKNQCFAANNNPNCPELYIGRFAKMSDDSLAKAQDVRDICLTRMTVGGKAVINQ